ncbi:protein FAR1-RELATED SEQUENCE 3-like [Cucumis melo var. makuwa]|uniref:Protein FAR1-RELATED SEQUENCE 3-like n=1 Tax=Cucumis melo var. makuwa TaxID=1194695 RepID=A0A5A7TYN9_CUCMM|nr:protein FAR1-RELATED SEQUENCE 3-like [Cucumis melo var. makuwa]
MTWRREIPQNASRKGEFPTLIKPLFPTFHAASGKTPIPDVFLSTPSWCVGKDGFPDAAPDALLRASGKPLFPTFFMPTCFSASGMLHFLVISGGLLQDATRFAYILELNNPSSVVEYKVDVDGRFLYFFMALSASISHWQHCHLVIFIDRTSLKKKNDSSWTWFCNQWKRIIGGWNEVVIVSDRHKSICKAIEAFNIVDFKHEMRLLESSTLGIREELESIGFAKWSCAYSPRRRYNVMTTNIPESLNSDMLTARELPICSMLEVIRYIKGTD